MTRTQAQTFFPFGYNFNESENVYLMQCYVFIYMQVANFESIYIYVHYKRMTIVNKKSFLENNNIFELN